MGTPPLVSVVIIFLNAEKFIEEAIASVLAQSYEHWELLLVDDGSNDASTGIARQYAQDHPGTIRYLEHDGHRNRGMSASRNLGIANATGKYIAFLDSDDVWLPAKLEQQVALLEGQPEAAMVYGPTLYWHSWTGKPEDAGRDFMGQVGVQPNTLVSPPLLLTLFLQSSGAVLPGICSLLVRRAAIKQTGGFEEAFRGTYEDQVFLSKICLKKPVLVTTNCLDKYRQHPDSCCYLAIATGEYQPTRPHPARLCYLIWLERYLCEQGVKEQTLWLALRKELWPYRHPLLSSLARARHHPLRKLKALSRSTLRRGSASRT